ncbi:DUF2909 domain-containing protein [Chitinilyticum litopenaei]|uniref:DUF2909 domain-containing protein n=1 Tax=Chitinilyticum litopenaei TaxID=1121276 RepID=UPI00040322F7|nr:DUF2909 domain-containing protein [Chitinilyticum litopenaei]
MKLLLVIVLIAIVLVLAHAMLLLVRGGAEPQKLARALTLRVGLSCGLFAMLVCARLLGWWPG